MTIGLLWKIDSTTGEACNTVIEDVLDFLLCCEDYNGIKHFKVTFESTCHTSKFSILFLNIGSLMIE